MNYSQTIDYIHAANRQGMRLGLDRITELCDKIGNPQNSLRFIHVAGTNGKGSFCAMLESVLRHAGYETGTFTSPFTEQFEERIQVGGKCITQQELAQIASFIKPFADEMEDPPSEFELVSAIAFEYFKRRQCRAVILETGLGGRLDSTNVIASPILSVITGIAMDHMAELGDSIVKIAAEKAGIIKPGCMVLYGGEHGAAEDVILKRSEELGCKCYGVDYSLLANVRLSVNGTTFDYGRYEGLELSLLGSYQLYNAARVITAAEILREGGVKITDDAVRIGLANTRWKGRFELFGRNPDVYFDGAHNTEGMEHTVKSIAGYYPGQKIALIMGVMKDKEYETMASLAAPLCERAFTVCPDNPRALPAEELAKIFADRGVYSTAYACFEDAVKDAYAYAKKNGVPLFCLGSLYAYSAFKQAVGPLLS